MEKNFIHNEKGALSIEFAAVFFVFVLFCYVICDIYTSITLQSKLDRTTYNIASLFRERSRLYPTLDDTSNGNLPSELSLCNKDSASCFRTNELFTQNQVSEVQQLATNLLGKDVAIRIDSLFLLQDIHNPGDLKKAKPVSTSITSCVEPVCTQEIKNYLNSLPALNNNNPNSTDYTMLEPFAEREITSQSLPYIKGRWIPLYRVNMCIINNESLYLKVSNRARKSSEILPNLCSEVIVISRCNDLDNPTKQCPIYITVSK